MRQDNLGKFMGNEEVNGPYKFPDGWRWVRLAEVCEFKHGGTPSKANPDFWNGIVPWVSPKDMHLTFIQDTIDHISNGAVQASNTSLVPAGTILVVVRSGILAHTLPVAVAGKELTFNQDIKAILPFSDRVEPWFLLWALKHQEPLVLSRGIKLGATVHSVVSGFLETLSIPLPPLEEQQRIASKLHELMHEVERARTACEQQLEAAKGLPAAYLRVVFESEEAKSWERKRLGEVCEIILGQSPPGSTYNRENIGLPFFQGKIDFGSVYPVPSTWCSKPIKIAQPSDILISVRAPVGPTNMANQKCCIGRGLAAIRPKGNIAPGFVFYFFRFIESDLSEKYGGRGSTFGAITREHLQELEIPLPPLPEQKRIAAGLKEKMAAVEKLRLSIEKHLGAINALPQALLRKAFRGEL